MSISFPTSELLVQSDWELLNFRTHWSPEGCLRREPWSQDFAEICNIVIQPGGLRTFTLSFNQIKRKGTGGEWKYLQRSSAVIVSSKNHPWWALLTIIIEPDSVAHVHLSTSETARILSSCGVEDWGGFAHTLPYDDTACLKAQKPRIRLIKHKNAPMSNFSDSIAVILRSALRSASTPTQSLWYPFIHLYFTCYF